MEALVSVMPQIIGGLNTACFCRLREMMIPVLCHVSIATFAMHSMEAMQDRDPLMW